MCVCVCVCVCVHVHVCVCVCVCVHKCIHVCGVCVCGACVHVCVHNVMCMCVHAYTKLLSTCSFALLYSNTVSRSCVFCAVVNAIEFCKMESVIDIFEVVKAIRIQKPGAIQTVVSPRHASCHDFLLV